MKLDGCCDGCGQPKSAKSLNLVLIRPQPGPRWVLLCGPCVVDGLNEAA